MSHSTAMGRVLRPFFVVALLLLSGTCVLPLAAQSDAADRVIRDLAYKPDAETEYERDRCKLDIYLPATGEGFATIVWFHGGGLEAGNKKDAIAATVAKKMNAEGVAVVLVDYRLSPNATYPAYIDDAAASVAFVHREIAKYGGSPERLFVSGHSAGGYLTAMVGLDPQYLKRYGMKTEEIAGLMPVSGQMITHSTVREERGIPREKPRMDEAAPTYHVRADAPPCLSIVGSNDMAARAEENRYFVAAMKAAGHRDVTYFEVEGRDHGSIASKIGEDNDPVANAMLDFIKRVAP